MPQTIDLFSGSVSENISRFTKTDDEKFKKVCDKFDLQEEYENYRNGKELIIGPDDYDLPGGYRQRIGLARAFYGDPKYIILDEPTSNLDTKAEIIIQNVLIDARKNGATIIVVTHNAKLIKLAEYLLIIKQGSNRYLIQRH